MVRAATIVAPAAAFAVAPAEAARGAFLDALRHLRAPLAALVALLVLAGAVPGTAVAGSLCLAVEAVAEGDDGVDAPDCPFCSAHAVPALAPAATPIAPLRPVALVGPAPALHAPASLPRGPPVGPRAPPDA